MSSDIYETWPRPWLSFEDRIADTGRVELLGIHAPRSILIRVVTAVVALMFSLGVQVGALQIAALRAGTDGTYQQSQHPHLAWWLVILLPEILFGATLVVARVRSGARFVLRTWLIAVAVLAVTGLLFVLIAPATGYHVFNAFPLARS